MEKELEAITLEDVQRDTVAWAVFRMAKEVWKKDDVTDEKSVHASKMMSSIGTVQLRTADSATLLLKFQEKTDQMNGLKLLMMKSIVN